jgi:quinolinate synthase
MRQNRITEKVVVMEPPTFNVDQLAHNTLEHMDPERSHRNGENVTEIKARVGDVVVAHEYHWWVPTSLCESLEDSLKLTKTKVPPKQR